LYLANTPSLSDIDTNQLVVDGLLPFQYSHSSIRSSLTFPLTCGVQRLWRSQLTTPVVWKEQTWRVTTPLGLLVSLQHTI